MLSPQSLWLLSMLCSTKWSSLTQLVHKPCWAFARKIFCIPNKELARTKHPQLNTVSIVLAGSTVKCCFWYHSQDSFYLSLSSLLIGSLGIKRKLPDEKRFLCQCCCNAQCWYIISFTFFKTTTHANTLQMLEPIQAFAREGFVIKFGWAILLHTAKAYSYSVFCSTHTHVVGIGISLCPCVGLKSGR